MGGVCAGGRRGVGSGNTALPRPEHVTAAFLSGDDGILAGMRPGSIWIEHSTTDFENTNRIKELVEKRRLFLK